MNSSNSKNETTGFWFGWITTRSCCATFYYCTCQPFNVRYESLCHLIHFFSRNDSRIKVKKTVSFLKLELFIPQRTIFFCFFFFYFFFFYFFFFYFFFFYFVFFYFTRFFIYFMVLSDAGPTLETLDFIRIGSTPTFLYFHFFYPVAFQ